MSKKYIEPVPSLPPRKLIWYCHDCGTILPLWKIKCPNCHHSAMSLLHVIVIAAVAIMAVFYLLKNF
jgi:ABC-type ATPase with predicted acetyltransferase domain